MRLLIIAIFLFAHALLPAQEQQENVQTPDPSLLKPTWWEIFVDKKSVVEQRSDNLITNLSSIPDDLAADKSEEAQNLIDQIKVNLQAWLNIIDQPLPLPKPATTLKESYTIDQLREVYNRNQKLKVDLDSKREELKSLEQQLKTTQERLDLARQGYQSAADRSQEKILFGLKILKFRPAVEVGKKKIRLLEKSIQIENDLLRESRVEIDTAKKRLVSESPETSLYARQLDSSKLVWDDAKKERQKQELIYAEQYAEEADEQSETNNNILTINLTDASIIEMRSRVDYIKEEILFQLSSLLVKPDEVQIRKLDISIKDWRGQLRSFDIRLEEWRTQIERILQRASQVLTLGEQEVPLNRTQLDQVVKSAQNTLLEIHKLHGDVNETTFLLTTLEEKSVGFRGQGAQWIKVIIDFVSGAWETAGDKLSKTLFYIGTHPVSLMTIVEFILIMIITWWFSRLVTGTINTFSKRRKGIRKALIYRLNRLIHYFILCIGGIVGLSWIGFDFSNLVLIAGALGVGIGFGLQNIFNNFISGIIILFQSHLKVGDYIELDTGLRGEIREINVRSTVVTTNDGVEVIIPNSEMVSNRIVNWTLRDPYRRVHVPFSVAYGSDLEEVTKIVVAEAKKVQSTLQRIGVREPQVFLIKLGDNGIEMELRVWVDEKWTRRNRNTRSQYLFAIERVLRENGFEIPFPQRDIHVKKDSLPIEPDK